MFGFYTNGFSDWMGDHYRSMQRAESHRLFHAFLHRIAEIIREQIKQIVAKRPVKPGKIAVRLFQPRWSSKRWRSTT